MHFTLKRLVGRIGLGVCAVTRVYGDSFKNFSLFAVADLFLRPLELLRNHLPLPFSYWSLSKTFRQVENRNIYMVGSILSYSNLEATKLIEYLLCAKHLMKYLYPLGQQTSKGHLGFL